MRAVLLNFKYFQRADKNKLQQQGYFPQIFNSRLKSDSWFRFVGGCHELLGAQMALYALQHGNHRGWRGRWMHEGSGTVGVYERAGCGRDQDVGGRKVGASSGRRQSAPAGRHQRRPARALAVFRWAPAPAGASTCLGCRRQAAILYTWTFCSSTHCTYRLQTFCNAARNQTALYWLHCSPIFGSKQVFRVNYIIITCFPIIATIITIYQTIIFHSLLHYYRNNGFIITSVITLFHHYHLFIVIIANWLLPIITVIMESFLPIIARSIRVHYYLLLTSGWATWRCVRHLW